MPPLTQAYSTGLVALSIVIAILASYTALDQAGRLHASEGRARALWLGGGALAMGVGIWSMHFVGMLALQLTVRVSYTPLHLIASIVVAIVASAFALSMAARPTIRQRGLIAAAIAMGLAIAGMHYIGMAGMHMPATVQYDSVLYWLSVAIAVTASYVALFIARRLRGSESGRIRLARSGAAIVMGLAISGMHYTGMAAANFIPGAETHASAEPGLPPLVLAMVVAMAGTMIVGLAMIAAMLDRMVRSRTIEAQLRAEKAAAEQTNRAKSEFLSNMSHELRTPLNSIIGFSNILLKNKAGNLRPLDLTHLERITSNGRHLLSVINGVLDLSKIEAGRMEVELEAVDAALLVRETLDEMASQAEVLEVELAAEIPAGLGMLYADRAWLKQIVINLAGNAMKFTRHGRVTVRLVPDARSGSPARLDVIDTGIGIPADRLVTIFDAFKQADNTTARHFGGTGLGLTITRSLAELMGWTISVQSTVGVGTTFSVQFGADVVTAPSPGTSLAAEPTLVGTPRSRFRVLVIDDEADSRSLIKHEFEELDCEVALAASADEGIALARRMHPDLITLDVMMPGKNGLDALHELKEDIELRAIPVIIVSVVAEESRTRAVGALDVLEKPMTRAAIMQMIANNAAEIGGKHLLLVKANPTRMVMVS